MKESEKDIITSSGSLSWMARNNVAANLLMLLFLLGGGVSMFFVKQELFPNVDLDLIQVSVEYPGSGPEEVEQGVILSIEDEMRSIETAERVTSIALEGRGVVNIEIIRGEDPNIALQEVKNKVDSIQSFPEGAERPIVSLVIPRRQVLSIIVYGDQPFRFLRDLAESMRDDLIQQPGITQVELSAVPDYEIAVEVPIAELRNHNLTLDMIAKTIGDTALEVSGGGIKTPGGEVLLRTNERRDYAKEFASIPIVTNPEGSNLLLGDIAKLRETFEEIDIESYFNGKQAIKIDVFRVGEQTPLEVSNTVKNYVLKKREELPKNIALVIWNDSSEIYFDRIFLLMRNAIMGLCLVLLLLGLFLEPRLAFWVTTGIPVSVIGSFLFIPITGATVNMISLFAFIITLGIIVDDAIVVGEIIYQKREEGMSHLEAAISGVNEIFTPVFFAVMTNIIAFCPLFFIPGPTGKLFLQIPAIVVSVLAISLIESLFVLPAHLAKEHGTSKWMTLLRIPSGYFNDWMARYRNEYFVKQVQFILKHHYFTVSFFISLFIIVAGLVLSQHIPFSYIPRVDSDVITVQAILPFGVPIEKARFVEKKLLDAANKTMDSVGGSEIIKGIYSQIGKIIAIEGPAVGPEVLTSGSHLVGAQIVLIPSDQRAITAIDFSRLWRENLGDLADIETITFEATVSTGEGMPISIELSHSDQKMLEEAAQELAQFLKGYRGVSQVDDSVSKGKLQETFMLKESARSMGITSRELARQIRAAFYGAEALRQQRGRHEVKVLVRLPKSERQSLETMENLVIFAPNGKELPLVEAAAIIHGRSYTDIQRADGRRVLQITADVDDVIANTNHIIEDVKKEFIPYLERKYPGISYTLQGQLKAEIESLNAMLIGFTVSTLAIYGMLAVPFKSYSQPLIVMLSMPFGFVGAVFGHLLLGYEISIMSIFGLVALSGVIVNDSLVLVVTANRIREEKKLDPYDCILSASILRFRPIILTSLTTFFGLSPMIFETSMQAKFLIPMAISLGFGVLFGTFIILMVIPAAFLIIEDIKKLMR